MADSVPGGTAVGVNFTLTAQVAPAVPVAVRLQFVGNGTKSVMFTPVTLKVTGRVPALLFVNVTGFEALVPVGTLPNGNTATDGVTSGCCAVIVREAGAEVLSEYTESPE